MMCANVHACDVCMPVGLCVCIALFPMHRCTYKCIPSFSHYEISHSASLRGDYSEALPNITATQESHLKMKEEFLRRSSRRCHGEAIPDRWTYHREGTALPGGGGSKRNTEDTLFSQTDEMPVLTLILMCGIVCMCTEYVHLYQGS